MKNSLFLFGVFVTLIIVADSCKKHSNPAPSLLSYTQKMGGMRKWTGIYGYPDPLTYLYNPSDTYSVSKYFAITILNDSTIQLNDSLGGFFRNNDNLTYVPSTDTSKILIFQGGFEYTDAFETDSITYFYEKDSIVLFSVYEDRSGEYYYYLHTP